LGILRKVTRDLGVAARRLALYGPAGEEDAPMLRLSKVKTVKPAAVREGIGGTKSP
jgi:hypothetical protein